MAMWSVVEVLVVIKYSDQLSEMGTQKCNGMKAAGSK